MKSYFVVLVLAFCGYASQAQQLTADQKAAQDVITGLFDTFTEVNADKARSFCTPDVKILENGVVWNLDSLVSRLKPVKGTYIRVNQLDFLETKVDGNICWLYYWNKAVITRDTGIRDVKWLESAVLLKQNNQWKISVLHSTVVERRNR